MKFCIKCGNQMTDEMIFCQNCGTENTTVKGATSEAEQDNKEKTKSRTGMKVWMIISFIFTAIFAIGATSDISMVAGVLLFGILGVMFFILAKTPKDSKRLFEEVEFLKKSKGISKGAFVGTSVFLAFFLFTVVMNSSTPQTTVNGDVEKEKTTIVKEEIKKENEISNEFSQECPIDISGYMYDNIIGFPELKCNIRNKTDKEISAIQIYFLPKDVYGEEVNGIFAQNKLQCDSPIPANGSDTIVWQMLEQNIKAGDVYVYSVYFADGTEWGDRNASTSKIKKNALKMEVSY